MGRKSAAHALRFFEGLRFSLRKRPVFSEAHGAGAQRRARQKEGFRHGSGPRQDSVCPGEDTLYPEACCVFQALRSCERFLLHGKEKGVREGLFHEPHIRMGMRFSSLRAGNCAGKGGIGPTSARAVSAAGMFILLFLFTGRFHNTFFLSLTAWRAREARPS